MINLYWFVLVLFINCSAINHTDQIKISFVYTNVNNQQNNQVNTMECLDCTYVFTDVETRKLIDAQINNIIVEPTEPTYLYLPHSSTTILFGKKQSKDEINNATECFFVDVTNWFFIFDGRKCVKGSSTTNEDSLKIFNRDLSVVSDIKTNKLEKLLEKMHSLVLVVKSKASDFMKNKKMYKPSKYSVVFNWRNKPKDWVKQREQKEKQQKEKNNLSTTKKKESKELNMIETMLNYGRSAVASVWPGKKEKEKDNDFDIDENLQNLNTKNVQTQKNQKQNNQKQIQNQKVENNQSQMEEVQKDLVETEEFSKPNDGINIKIIFAVIGGVIAGVVLIVVGLWYFLRKRGSDKYKTVSHNDI